MEKNIPMSAEIHLWKSMRFDSDPFFLRFQRSSHLVQDKDSKAACTSQANTRRYADEMREVMRHSSWAT
jgi:hypothetical protein